MINLTLVINARGGALAALFLTAAASFACGGDDCDEEAIAQELSDAMPGDTVTIGACTVRSGFTVKAGVTLQGEGPSSVIDSNTDAVAITFEGDGRAEVRDLNILSRSRAAVLGRGAGERVLSGVAITVEKGVGLAFENASLVELSNVAVTGPINSGNAVSVSSGATPMTHATHGLILVSIGDAQLSQVTISGFASVGALFVSSTVDWDGGSASDNLALGLGVEGGEVTLNEVSASRTFQGRLLLPAYGAVFTGNATVATTRLHVNENEGFGFLQHTGRGDHSNVDASDNDNAAAWAQSVAHFDLTGVFLRNKFAGVVLVDVLDAVVHNSQIEQTIGVQRIIDGIPRVVGDGIQMVRSADTSVLRDVTLTNNERVGALLELGGQTVTAATLDRVTVNVSNSSRGVVAQNGPKDPTWDSGVTRNGVSMADDNNAPALQSVEAVGPCNRPLESNLAISGLMSLIGL